MNPFRQVKTYIPVLKDLPEGIHETRNFLGELREAWGTTQGEFKQYHYCPKCEGWIEGHAEEIEHDDLKPEYLAGRKGTSSCCRRCGYEISFWGLMS